MLKSLLFQCLRITVWELRLRTYMLHVLCIECLWRHWARHQLADIIVLRHTKVYTVFHVLLNICYIFGQVIEYTNKKILRWVLTRPSALLDSTGFIYLFYIFRWPTITIFEANSTFLGLSWPEPLALRKILGSILFSSFSPFLLLFCI